MKRTILLTTITLFSFCYSLSAQNLTSDYSFAVGVKMLPGSMSLKKGISDTHYLEGLVAFWFKGFRATLLYEIHNPINNVEGLRWYYGFGPHLGFYSSKYYNGNTLVGIDGVIGLDYKIKGVPFNISLDWQPSFEFGDGSGFDGWGGLGVRYTF
jgi:hypothetical protein